METEQKSELQQAVEQLRLVSLWEIAKTFLHIGLVSYSLAALEKLKNHW